MVRFRRGRSWANLAPGWSLAGIRSLSVCQATSRTLCFVLCPSFFLRSTQHIVASVLFFSFWLVCAR